MATLASYRTQVRRLLHDANDSQWSVTAKDAYVNEAIQRRDLDTGANRVIQVVNLVTGTDTYAFTALGDPTAFDVISICLRYGGQRVVLGQHSVTELNAFVRTWITYRSYPVAWAKLGAASVLLGPIPSQAWVTEWDTSVITPTLATDASVDPLPYPYTIAVPYYAAYLAKLNERRYQEADTFQGLYRQELLGAVNQRAGMVPSVYSSRAGRA